MPSPAERFAAAARRTAHPILRNFTDTFPFTLDPFQVRACEALEDGHGVLVAAPTGSGKTVVGEFAVELALRAGGKCFYTTPIKALSNQKFHDLGVRYGAADVGLLTGDTAVNASAPVVVMTTEVLRNMLYAGSSTLSGLTHVVMDEVHYLADRFRGAVWEEVILHLPFDVRLVSLSATVSNAEEFGEWLGEVRGDTTVIVEDHRPVPLWQHVLVGNRLYDVFLDAGQGHDTADINPQLARLASDEARFARTHARHDHRRNRRPASRIAVPARPDVVERLDAAGLLPAIMFIFSRAGCDAGLRQCLHAGLRLTSPDERAEIRDIVEARSADIPDEDLGVLGYADLLEGLQRGFAAHHAGMLPVFKETVEDLFARGLVKVVFATETLALGVNMPARSVVLEALSKWNGEAHADLTPGEYTQLTGRAGRRGIDIEGHGVVLWTPGFDPRQVARLASTRTYPLRSSFRPSYNMAVNLVGQLGRAASRELLESSFAQFQADRGVVGLARQVRRNREALDGYRDAMTCHLGDFGQYAALRRELSDREASLARESSLNRKAEIAASLAGLRVGDVIRMTSGRRPGLAVVVDPSLGGEPRPSVVTDERQLRRVSAAELSSPVEKLSNVRLPKNFQARSPQSRRDLASTLRNLDLPPSERHRRRSAAADDEEIARLRRALRAHPCHGCAEREDHARWAERYYRLIGDTEELEQRMAGRTGTLARQFDQVCGVLDELGYLSEDTVTDAGRSLARIYSESDLLVAEAMREGLFDTLDRAELAAVVSALVYQARRDDAPAPRIPRGQVRDALSQLRRLHDDLQTVEAEAGLDGSRELDPGFAQPTWMWANGQSLSRVLAEAGVSELGLAPGDFVRWMKQIIDLLDQIRVAAPEGSTVAATARASVEALRRGVVAYSSVA